MFAGALGEYALGEFTKSVTIELYQSVTLATFSQNATISAWASLNQSKTLGAIIQTAGVTNFVAAYQSITLAEFDQTATLRNRSASAANVISVRRRADTILARRT